MTAEEFIQATQELASAAQAVAEAKRPDYTQESVDVLQNFKDAGRDAGITPLQAWLVHLQKHYSAVARAVKNPSGVRSEPIQGRFIDLRNYLDLGYALFQEAEGETAARNQRDPSLF